MWGLLVWGSSLSGIQSSPQPVMSAVQAVAFAWNAASAAVHECPASTCIRKGQRSPRRSATPNTNFRLLQPLQVTGVKLYVTVRSPRVFEIPPVRVLSPPEPGAALRAGARMTKR